MKVIKKKIRWDAGTAPDITAHRVYVEKDPTIPTYTSVFAEILVPQTYVVVPDDFPVGTFDEDTTYIMGVSSVDDVGNESDIITVSSPFDFVAPDAPTNITIEDLI